MVEVMPLFIKSLPLSLKTFWRYLLLLPLLAIFAFLLSLLQFIPFIGLLIPGIVSTGLLIIGFRCALAANGHHKPLDTGTLLTVSVVFCILGIIFDVLLSGAYWIFLKGLQATGVELDPIGLLAGLLGFSIYWAGVLLALLSPKALLGAALAVPMTAAAFAATPRGGDINYFFGIGSGMFSLLVVSIFWLFGGHIFTIVGEIWTTFGLIAFTILDWWRGEPLFDIDLPGRFDTITSILIMTWASSWFFATAVLAWERKVDQQRAKLATMREANRPSTEDIRAMRQRRMK